jgi:hypothetical protein
VPLDFVSSAFKICPLEATHVDDTVEIFHVKRQKRSTAEHRLNQAAERLPGGKRALVELQAGK